MKNIILLSFIVLCGCTSTGSKVAENTTVIPADRGIVLFSTGADKTNRSFSTGLNLVQAETRKRYDRVIINIDYPFTSNFASEHGHVRTLTLPEGDYFLVPNSGNPAFCLTKYPTFRFTVKRGVITYIGSFQLSSNHLVQSNLNQQRDVQYFRKKNPGLASQDIFFQNLIVSAEKFDICAGSSFVKGIIWELP